MTEEQTATPEGLVVALEAKRGKAKKVSETLPEIGQVSPLGGGELALVRPAAPKADARAAWVDLLRRCPEAAWAAPVLKDSEGNEHFPTGSLVVRFRERPTEKTLRAFATDHGLALESRNEFVPQQASFRPRRPRETYLPDLIAKVVAQPEVAFAWAGTLSKYRRA